MRPAHPPPSPIACCLPCTPVHPRRLPRLPRLTPPPPCTAPLPLQVGLSERSLLGCLHRDAWEAFSSCCSLEEVAASLGPAGAVYKRTVRVH